MKLSKNFNSSEFLCPCCKAGEDKISAELIERLQKFRDYIKLPIYINSGYRCEKYNKEVGGAKNSYHLQGCAVDISVYIQVSETAKKILSGPELLKLLHKSGIYFGGVGVATSYLHLDIRKSPDFWFYGDVLRWVDSSVYSKKSSPVPL